MEVGEAVAAWEGVGLACIPYPCPSRREAGSQEQDLVAAGLGSIPCLYPSSRPYRSHPLVA